MKQIKTQWDVKSVDAFLDFLKIAVDGMKFIADKDFALVCLDYLRKQGLDVSALWRRISRSSYFDELLERLACQTRQTSSSECERLVSLIIAESEKYYLDYELKKSTIENALSMLLGNTDEQFGYVLKYHREVIMDPEYFLYENTCLGSDDWWRGKVTYYLMKPDYRRTWDELKRAHLGLLRYGDNPPAAARIDKLTYHTDPAYRAYAASTNCLERLVRDLFFAMVGDRMIDLLNRDDLLLDCYSGVAPKGKIPPSYSFAKRFTITQKRDGQHLGDTAACVIKIARYMSDQDNARRRDKNLKQVREKCP